MNSYRRGAFARAVLFAMLQDTRFARRELHDALEQLHKETKPDGCGVHLSKTERKGKSWKELQKLRAQRSKEVEW